MAETSQKTLIDITALKYFYKSLQNVTVLIAPSTVEAASSSNLGHTYFIPADGTYAGVKCDKGDHIVSNGTTWVRIPKGTGSGEGTTYYAGEGIDISTVDGKDTIANTGVLAVEEADDTNKGAVKVTTKDGSSYVPVHGLGTAAYADVTDTYAEDGTVPVSGKAVKSAISGKLDASEKGANGGVAELDESGKVLSSQLPSYVDDVIEATSKSEFPTTGESGKIYVDTTTNLSYRWAGTDYVEISPSIALGETSATAFRGDRGKTAYDHATTTETNPHGTTKSDVGLGNVDNTSDTDKPISTATQTALNGKVPTTRKVNGKDLSADVTLSGADVAVTGYAKASTASAIAATDTVNVALGKVEKALDGKAASSHNQASNTITAMTGYSAGTSKGAIAATDSLNTAIAKLENTKACKTSVSYSKEGGETTSVINVTDAKAQMAMVAKISGKTVKFNQIILDQTKGTNKYDGNNITVTTSDHHTITVDKNPSTLTAPSLGAINFTKDHVYYVTGCPDGGGSNSYSMDCPGIFECSNAIGSRFTVSSTTTASARLRLSPNTTWTNKTFKPQLYDLTVMFGSGKEPTLEQCAALFSGINSVYNVGTLWSAAVESVVSVGKNRFNGEYESGYYNAGVDGSKLANVAWKRSVEFIEIKPSTQYYITYPSAMATVSENGSVCFYDANKNYIDFSYANIAVSDKCYKLNKVTPSNAKYATWYQKVTNTLTPCFSVEQSFIPYNKTTVLVPSEARNCVGYGLGISDSVCNIADFENGVYTQMCGIVDLGDLTYALAGSEFKSTNFVSTYNAKIDRGGLCAIYTGGNTYTEYSALGNKAIHIDNNGGLYIKDNSYSTGDALKAALKGVKFVFELASAKTTALTDFIRPLPVENGGTLTLVNEHSLDVNSVIKYKKEV